MHKENLQGQLGNSRFQERVPASHESNKNSEIKDFSRVHNLITKIYVYIKKAPTEIDGSEKQSTSVTCY